MNDGTALYQGLWQSCRSSRADDPGYGEGAHDYKVNGRLKWSFHLGPFDEFALFRAGEEPDPDNHYTTANLLAEPHALRKSGRNGSRQWNIPSLNLWISVVQAGGSRDDCQAFYVLIKSTRELARW